MQKMQETRASIPGSGRSPGGGNGNPLQYSCLGKPMDRGAWWATVWVVTKSLEEEKENQNFGQVFSAWKVHKISVWKAAGVVCSADVFVLVRTGQTLWSDLQTCTLPRHSHQDMHTCPWEMTMKREPGQKKESFSCPHKPENCPKPMPLRNTPEDQVQATVWRSMVRHDRAKCGNA